MKRRLISLGLGLIVIVALLLYRSSLARDQSASVRGQVVERLERLDDFGTHRALYEQWLDAHHQPAFDDRLSATGFDGEGYLNDLFTGMAADARAAGYDQQALEIESLRDRMSWDSP